MSEENNSNNSNPNTPDKPESATDEVTGQSVPRRRFLGKLVAGAAAGTAATAYNAPTAQAAGSGDCGGGDIHWDVDHFDDAAVFQAAELMASYSYSPSAARNIDALVPIAEKWREVGARGLDDSELDRVFQLGWLPTAELNADEGIRGEVNAALGFADKVWGPTPDNWGEYQSPLPEASRARLARFEAGVEVQAVSAILVGIIIVILVVDFPAPAN